MNIEFLSVHLAAVEKEQEVKVEEKYRIIGCLETVSIKREREKKQNGKTE